MLRFLDSWKVLVFDVSIAIQLSTHAAMEWTDRIGRRIKLRDLHILLAVAQSGSMARAAERLAISQPVVSKTIADLEHTLGVRLLDRDRRGAEPTVYGRALLDRGEAAFDELRQGVKDIEYLLDPTAGELRIGASDPMAAALVPAIILRLTKEYPRITFHVTGGPSILVQHYRALRERTIDLIIGRLPRPLTDKDLNVEVLYDEPLLIAAGAQNPLVKRRRLRLADLIDEPWVLPGADSLVGSVVAELFRASGLEFPRKSVFCSSIQMNNTLLADGNYLAIYPGSIIRLSAERLAIKVLDVDLPVRASPLGIVTLKGRTVTPVARLFIDCARAITKSLALGALPRPRRSRGAVR